MGTIFISGESNYTSMIKQMHVYLFSAPGQTLETNPANETQPLVPLINDGGSTMHGYQGWFGATT